MPCFDGSPEINSVRRRDNTRYPQAGFTLIEIIIVILVLGIIGLVSSQYILQLIRLNRESTAQTILVEGAKIGMELLAREIRDADNSIEPIRCGPSQVACQPAPTTYDEITFDKLLESPVDPLRRDTNANDIRYAYNSGSQTIERTSSGITSTVMDKVTSFEITQPSTNNFQFEIQLAGPDGENITLISGARARNAALPFNLVLVCSSASCTDPDMDVPLNNHLTLVLGHNVTFKSDTDQAWTPSDFNAVIISASVTESNLAVNNFYRDAAVGILSLDGLTGDELDLGTDGSDTGSNNKDINIIDNTHFITQIFPLGPFDANNPEINMGYIQNWANDVTLLGDFGNPGTRGRLVYVDRGGTLAGGVNIAQGRRVFFGARYFAELTDLPAGSLDGRDLFNRCLTWVTQ
jgi:prepilin-type N-terminal cleavage/methylation domain-containing protein